MNRKEQVKDVQSTLSGPEVAQKIRRAGKSHVDYWTPRLMKRTYESKGKVHEVDEWYVRIKHLGRREWYNTGTPNRATASVRARDFYLSLLAAGWDATLAKFKPKSDAAPKLNLTAGDYLTAVKDTAYLRPRTFLNYQNCFRTLVSEVFGVKGDKSKYDYRQGGNRKWTERIDRIRLERVTAASIVKWQQERVKKAGSSPAAIASAKRTANSYVRCARSLFTKEIRKRLKGIQLPTTLPFDGVELFEQGSMKYISKVDVHALIAAARSELKPGEPEVYKAFLLGLFAGMRRSEIDLLEWRMVDWQNHIIRLEETEWLHLKTQDSAGEITIDPEVSAELRGFKAGSQSPFIIVSDRKPRNDSARVYYRCEPVFDRLTAWLRNKGVNANKPLHEMRKEIGALVATKHGIFAASRFLRHSDITTTARFYAQHKARISVGLGRLLDNSIRPARTAEDEGTEQHAS